MKKIKLRWLDFLVKINAKELLRDAVLNTPNCDDIELFKTKHADIIVKIFADEKTLSEKALLKVFDLPNAKEILKKYGCQWHNRSNLPYSFIQKLFSTPEMKDVWLVFMERMQLPEFAELVILSEPNAKELALVYINNGIWRKQRLSPAAQLKMLESENNLEILKAYVQKDYLTAEAEVKMFEQPNALELLKTYTAYYGLYEEAELKMLELPEPARTELLHEYLKHYNLAPKAEVKAFEILNQKELTAYMLYNDGLHDENEPLLLKQPNGVELMKLYVENHEVSDAAVEAIFNHPEAAKILPALVNQPLDLEHEKRLFTMPNAVELLLTYIENNELKPESQMLMFDLPQTDSATVLKAYATEHEFALPVRQRLAVNNYLH